MMTTDFSTTNVNEFIEYIKEEFNKSTDRGAAVIVRAAIEYLLKKLLLEKMIDDSNETGVKNIIKELSLDKALKFCYGLNLIDKELYKEIDILRNIGNKFAHTLDKLFFDKPPISEYIEKLELYKEFTIESNSNPFPKNDGTPTTELTEISNKIKFTMSSVSVFWKLFNTLTQIKNNNQYITPRRVSGEQ